MSLSCSCDYDGDYPAFYSESRVRARKPHKCCECSGVIGRGETYRRATGCWDGRVSTFKTCADCLVVICDFGKATNGCECLELGRLAATMVQTFCDGPEEEAKRLLLPIMCAFNAASKERGGFQIKINQYEEP